MCRWVGEKREKGRKIGLEEEEEEEDLREQVEVRCERLGCSLGGIADCGLGWMQQQHRSMGASSGVGGAGGGRYLWQFWQTGPAACRLGLEPADR